MSDDAAARPRRARDRSNRTALAVAGGAVATLVLVGCCGFGAVLTALTARRATNPLPGTEVTRAPIDPAGVETFPKSATELTTYLEARGLKYSAGAHPDGDWLMYPGDHPAVNPQVDFVEWASQRCLAMNMRREPTPIPGAVGDIRYRWRQFRFIGPPDQIQALRQALEKS